jgi:ferredoxin
MFEMAHVVTAACYGCKYTDCVLVCPVDAFREGERMLYIDPESCIDCQQCVPECPVEAIFLDEDAPAEMRDFIALNAEMAAKCPEITEKQTPLCA